MGAAAALGRAGASVASDRGVARTVSSRGRRVPRVEIISPPSVSRVDGNKIVRSIHAGLPKGHNLQEPQSLGEPTEKGLLGFFERP